MNSNRNWSQVESQRGWLIFILCVLVATFIGGAFRAFLSPAQLRFWIEAELAYEQPKFNLKFEDVAFTLSEGWSPRFGVEFNGLLIESKDICITRSKLNIDNLYVPISLYHLIMGEFRFSDIHAREIEYVHRSKICNANLTEAEDIVTIPPDPSVDDSQVASQDEPRLSEVKSFLQNRLSKEIYNTRKWFSTLSIDKMTLYRESKPEQILVLTDFYFDVFRSEDELEIDSDLDLNFTDTAYDSEPVHLKIQLSNKSINSQLNGSFKEGKVSANMVLDVQSGQIKTTTEFVYMPVNELVNIWNSFRTTKLKFHPKLMWLNCKLNGSALFDEYKSMRVGISDCNITGDAGQLVLQPMTIEPFSETQIPLRLNFKKLSLKKILEYFDSGKKLNGVLTHYGDLYGEAVLHQKNHYEFLGKVKDIELLFSSRGKKRIQKIKEMKIEVTWRDSRVSGLIDEVNMSQGEFVGDVSFNFDHHFSDGNINLQVNKLQFNEQINQLMALGQIQPIEIYGKAQLNNAKLSDWSGAVGTHGISSDKWKIKNIKIKSKLENEALVNQFSIEELVTQPNTVFANYLYPLFLDFQAKQATVVLQNITGQVSLSQQKGMWKNFAASSGTEVLLASAGEWSYRGPIRGWISVDLEKLKLLTWEVTGNSDSPEIMPTIKMLKRLSQKDSSLKVPETNQAKVRMNFLRKILKQDNISKLKKFGGQVVEKAKSILPKLKKQQD